MINISEVDRHQIEKLSPLNFKWSFSGISHSSCSSRQNLWNDYYSCCSACYTLMKNELQILTNFPYVVPPKIKRLCIKKHVWRVHKHMLVHVHQNYLVHVSWCTIILSHWVRLFEYFKYLLHLFSWLKSFKAVNLCSLWSYIWQSMLKATIDCNWQGVAVQGIYQ